MALKQTIQEHLKKFLQSHDQIAVSVLRMLLAAIGNKEIEKRTKISKEQPGLKESQLQEKSMLGDEETQDVISGEARKHRESIEAFQKGNRQDLVDQETKELKVLESYLPVQPFGSDPQGRRLSEEEIRNLVEAAVEKTKASSQKEMGKVMAILMPQVKGKADGSLVSKIVREFLS